MAEAFREAGYATFGLMNNSQVTAERGFHRGFDDYATPRLPDEELLEEAIAWLDEPPDRWFAWVHFISPHSPYDRRDEAAHLYEPYEGPFSETTTSDFHPTEPADMARVRALYDGEVFFADTLFGRLFAAIDEQVLDETLVLVTADHGEEFGEHGRYQHWSLHEEGLRVPLLIRYPGGNPRGRVERRVSQLDLWPTLASIVGIEPPEASDGVDLLDNKDQGRPIPAVAMTDTSYRGAGITAGDWRLIVDCLPERRAKLFDLASDPTESRDVAESEPLRTRELLAELRRIVGPRPCDALVAAIRGADPTAGLADETVEELRALGYID